jgi:large subunit ribosomal protein L35
MKTKRSLRRRVRVTGTGKLVRYRAGRRHLQARKNAKRRRQLRNPTQITGGTGKTYSILLSPGL